MVKQQKEFIAKYDAQIRLIAIAENVDMMVADAMFVYEIKCRLGIVERVDYYKGIPEDYDWTEAEADFKRLLDK